MPPSSPGADRPLLDLLLAERGRFLAFLKRRVPEAAAEDILQTAYLRALERGRTLRDRDSAVAWFYRVLRRAWIDQYRRDGSASRARRGRAQAAGTAGSRVAATPPSFDDALHRAVCACVDSLLPSLKPEYAAILERVDLGGETPTEAAAALGLTANNATVRLHRARKALRGRLEEVCGTCTEHKCLDCGCRGRHPGV